MSKGRQKAAELIAFSPDLILVAAGITAEAVLKREPDDADRTRAVHRPGRRWLRRQPGATGGSVTGFTQFNTAWPANGSSFSRNLRPT